MAKDEGAKSDSWWNPRRIYEFGKNVVSLEKTVIELKEENRELREQVRNLQQQTSKLTGNMEVLVDFVKGAIDSKIAHQVDSRVNEIMRQIAIEAKEK